MTAIYYKVTNTDGTPCHGGEGAWDLPTLNPDGTWTPGAWREVEGDLVACARGLHAATPDQLVQWLGPAIWQIEYAEEPIDAGDKVVGRRARLIRGFPGWNERTARHFAADCAEDVLHLADPAWRETLEVVLYVVRCYADGGATDEERDAARAAAWDAAGAAAGDAAGDAARAAAWAAAWAAAGARQTDRLMEYLA